MNLKEEFKLLIVRGFSSARSAHDELFNEKRYKTREQERFSVVIGYLSIASSYINAAHAVAINNDQFHGIGLETFFHKFNVFQRELLTSIKTNHSHQWTNIEFLEFEKSYKEISFYFDIIIQDTE